MIRNFARILATLLLFLFIRDAGSAETLVWQDEFYSLDPSKWSHMISAWGGGAEGFQYNRNDRRNRYLEIKPFYLQFQNF
jgi:hypothetical protein